MKKTIILILFIITISCLTFLGTANYLINNEKFYQSPCESSGELIIDSLRNQYKISVWSSYPKNFCAKCDDYDSTLVDCKIITCRLGLNEPKLDFQQDSMIYNIMNLFWSFPQNKMVDSLFLIIINNEKEITTKLQKEDLKKYCQKIYYDSIKDFSIFDIDKIMYDRTEYGGGGDYEKYKINTREIILKSTVDLFDYSDVAEYYYRNNLEKCKIDNISTLSIKIETINPKGQFVKTKSTNYVFEIVPFTSYYKKKNIPK